MSRDRSLDEFLPGGSDDDEGPDESAELAADPPDAGTTADADADGTDDTANPSESDGPDGSDGPADAGADATGDAPTELVVRPAESTLDWTPGGAACAACGTSVERRWRDGGQLVCADCKEW